MKAFHLRVFLASSLLVILAAGLARAGTLTANGAVIQPHEDAQPNACANPPCVYTPATAPAVNNDPNSEAGLRNQASQARMNAQAHPARRSRVPEGGTFYFLLIGAVVFFFARLLFKGDKPAGR